jgi:hypothetical protein
MQRLLPDWWILIAVGYWEWTLFKRYDLILTKLRWVWRYITGKPVVERGFNRCARYVELTPAVKLGKVKLPFVILKDVFLFR